jgi:hypothetical protein
VNRRDAPTGDSRQVKSDRFSFHPDDDRSSMIGIGISGAP